MEVSIYNTAGEVVGTITLRDDVFGVAPNEALIHQAMVRQLANARAGTAATKTRGMVEGGGRKPYRQKGTGRARQGSIRAPHFRGGGIVFGPQPRSYVQAMPKKARRLALKGVLSAHVADNELRVVDALTFEQPKTKQMIEVLHNLKAEGSTLILLPDSDINVIKSAANIPGVHTLPVEDVNVVAALKHRYLVMPVAAVRRLESLLGADDQAPATVE